MRFPRHSLSLLVFSLVFLGASPGRAADISFVRVWPGYRTAASFERMSEYFDGQENTGGQTILRSQPAERTGFYFFVRLRNAGPAVPGATFELSVITPTSATPRILTFTADLPAGGHVFNLGLTGTDWPGEKAQPVAWKLVVRAPGGAEAASTQSFLWEKPPGQN